MALLLAHWIPSFIGSNLGEIGSAIFAVGIIWGVAKKWGRGILDFFKKAHNLVGILDYELQSNGGGSIKDHSEQAMTFSKGALKVSQDTEDKVDTLTDRFNSYIQAHAVEHQALANATLVQFPAKKQNAA